MNESIKLANENELQEQTLIANGNLRELTFSPQTKYLILPIEWQEIELESLFGFVIGGDWGKDCDFEHIDFVDAFCIRGSEFKHWDKYRGASASLRKIKHSSLQIRQLRLDDILIEISGGGPDQPVGRTVIIDERVINQFVGKQLVCTNFLRLARPIVNVDSTFLNYYLKCFYLSGEVIKYQAGSNNLRNLKFKEYSQIFIPLPPLAEQQQIAAKLDELLAQVDNLKTRLDTIPKILKRFRQSVLAAAVSGKLTEDWRELNRNIKFLTNAVELDDFRGNKLSTLPESWQWLTFDQVASVASNLHDPLLTPNAFHIAPNHIESGTGKLLEYTTIANDKVTSAKHQFYSGQILYSKIRPYLCKVAIATFQGLCSADMYPIDAKINTQFLFRWMLSHQFTDWASNAESRSVLPKINQKDLGVIPVPTPPLEEQTEIVARVEQLFTYADQIEQRVKDAQSRVNHLTQAILAKAFRGELTAEWRAQNPELISGENSAKALLARIKAEREMVAKPKKMGKKVNA